jgi:hypothetical protein
MEEINAKVKLSVEGSEQVQSAFTKMGGSINATSLNIATLISNFQNLYSYAKDIGKFFLDSALDASESSRQYEIMKGRVEAAGIGFNKVSQQISDYTKKMLNLGIEDEKVNQALGRFVLKSKNVEEAMRYTTLASDLAASGFGDMSSNVDLLEKIMIGKGARALIQYGIHLDENATKTEQLAAVQSKVIMTTEEFADTTAGSVAKMKVAWGEFKERIGEALGPLTTAVLTNFSNSLSGLNEAGETTSQTFGKKLLRAFQSTKAGIQDLWDVFTNKLDISNWSNSKKLYSVMPSSVLDTHLGQLKKQWAEEDKKATEVKKKSNKDLGSSYDETSDLLKKTAEEEADIFARLAKDVVSSFEKQSQAIKDYKKDIEDLDKTYKEKLGDMARTSQEKIGEIDKQIAEEKSTMNRGWRTRVEDLEKQRTEQESILSRIGGTGKINVSEALAKDELDILQEKYLTDKSDLQSKISDIQSSMENNAMRIASSDFWNKYIEENKTLAGEIGIGEMSQSFTFNFNGDVNDKEALMKSIIDTLNREATLRGVGK